MRSRLTIALALAGTIVFGLATRSSAIAWPPFVATHFGDALWSVALYLSLCLLAPQRAAVKIALTTLAISFAVEFSQLIQWPWLIAVRDTLPGRLLLGSGFVWADLPRYLAGVLTALFIDKALLARGLRLAPR